MRDYFKPLTSPISITIILFLSACREGETIEPAFYTCDFNFADSSLTHPEHQQYPDLLANRIYFPDDSTTIVYAVNSNYGKIDPFISTQAAMENIMETVK